MRKFTYFKMADTTGTEKSLDLVRFMDEVQKYDCLCNKFSTEYKDNHKKTQ